MPHRAIPPPPLPGPHGPGDPGRGAFRAVRRAPGAGADTGLHGIGTEGAVLAAADRSPLLDMARRVDGDDFTSVINVHVNGFVVTRTQVEVSVRL